MTETIEQRIAESMAAADNLYYRLVLLVGKSGTGKTSVINNLAKKHKTESINVNLRLSEELLEIEKKQRQLAVRKILDRIVNRANNVAFLDNIEILFDFDLNQNPLLLLQNLSRNLIVVSTWNGEFKNGMLTYAVPTHREYRNFHLKDALVVCMSGMTTIGSNQSHKESSL